MNLLFHVFHPILGYLRVMSTGVEGLIELRQEY
jgi:hypothetical protein